MSGDLDVRGGASGWSVQLTELERAAAVVRSVGTEVAEVAVAVGLTAREPALALAGIVVPVEYVAAEQAILGCAGRAAGVAAQVSATGLATQAAVSTYRVGETAVEGLFDDVATGVAAVAGATLGPVLVGGAVALAPGATAALEHPGAREAAVAVGLGAGRELDGILRDHPWLVPAAADGLDGLVLGAGVGLPGLGTWLAWRSGRLGVPYPPRDREAALDVILAATQGVALDESDHEVSVRVAHEGSAPAPTDVADLVAPDGPTSGGARVRVTGLPQPDGSWAWVVDIPGTQTFNPRAGDNPWDLTSTVLLSAERQTLTTRAVTRALADAQYRAGATGRGRVMLTGHSQGGVTAAALAASPEFRERHEVTHVVTSGAPIANLAVPEDISVLSLEHSEDLVPGLEGRENPDRETWVTVRRDVAGALGPEEGATRAHHVSHYAETARLVDASDDPSLAAWRHGASDYLSGAGGEAIVRDYDIVRTRRP